MPVGAILAIASIVRQERYIWIDQVSIARLNVIERRTVTFGTMISVEPAAIKRRIDLRSRHVEIAADLRNRMATKV